MEEGQFPHEGLSLSVRMGQARAFCAGYFKAQHQEYVQGLTYTGSTLLWFHRKDGILGLSEPEGAILTPAVLTEKPEQEEKRCRDPAERFHRAFTAFLNQEEISKLLLPR